MLAHLDDLEASQLLGSSSNLVLQDTNDFSVLSEK